VNLKASWLVSPWSWNAVTQDPPVISDRWVKQRERVELDLDAHYFFGEEPQAVPWLMEERLVECSLQAGAQVVYQPGTGFPVEASMGNPTAFMARDHHLDHYAVRIGTAEILGAKVLDACFLAMPAPRAGTICDEHSFMKILWQQQVGLVVRLTDWEGADYWSSAYWKAKRPIELAEQPYEDWPDNDLPPDDRFFSIVLETAESVAACKRPVAIHCNAGIGRTGTLIAAVMIKAQLDARRTADPWGIVLELRKRRRWLVYTFGQFLGLYRFASWYKKVIKSSPT
jgi:hypothetical protein